MRTLVVSETATSTWNYHLREVREGKLFPSGAAPPALCGAKLGWDTHSPLKAWGMTSHVPYKWCAECEKLAAEDLQAVRE